MSIVPAALNLALHVGLVFDPRSWSLGLEPMGGRHGGVGVSLGPVRFGLTWWLIDETEEA